MKKIILCIIAMAASATIHAQMPIIGVSGYVDGAKNMVNVTYTSAVRLAGGCPLVIPVTSDDRQIEAVLDAIDALVMTGGADFDPLKWYGEEPHQELGEIQPARDEFDVKLIRAAVKRGIPVLGICRGEQLMAVAFGGKLWQDIPAQVPSSYVKHRQGSTPGSYGTHSVNIEKGSRLAEIIGKGTISVNSFHHQAVKDLPKGFKVNALAADGIIEGIERVSHLDNEFEDGGGIIIGVQFHPEALTTAGDRDCLKIFEFIVKAASSR